MLRTFLHRSPRLNRNFSSFTKNSAIFYVRFGNKQKRPNHRFKSEYLVGAGVLGAGYYVSHLEQVPETGRWRFMNTSPATEEKISQAARAEVLQEFQHKILPQNHILSRHVKRVVTQLLNASNLGHIRGETPPHLQSAFVDEQAWDPDSDGYQSSSRDRNAREWEIIVINDSKIANAMAVPGMIIVFTGILPVCKDERGLSAVLSHEIGHVVARHTAERISSTTLIWGFFGLLQLLFIGLDPGITYWATQLLIEYPNSRTQELEADKIGMNLMARACFDPKGAVEMFERLRQLESQSVLTVSFFNTHPSSTKRVEELEKLLPEAYSVLDDNPDCAAVQDRMQSFRQVALTGIREM